MRDQTTVFKVNLSFGFILRNTETGDLQYFHASANNNRVLDAPFQIGNENDTQQLIEQLQNIDYIEWIGQQRPTTKFVVDWVSNVAFFVTKVRGHPIGRTILLPRFIKRNMYIISLECDHHGVPYHDWLCFFRCLALHCGARPTNLKTHTKHYYQQQVLSNSHTIIFSSHF